MPELAVAWRPNVTIARLDKEPAGVVLTVIVYSTRALDRIVSKFLGDTSLRWQSKGTGTRRAQRQTWLRTLRTETWLRTAGEGIAQRDSRDSGILHDQ